MLRIIRAIRKTNKQICRTGIFTINQSSSDIVAVDNNVICGLRNLSTVLSIHFCEIISNSW